jgi:hypothetical protein
LSHIFIPFRSTLNAGLEARKPYYLPILRRSS